MLWDIGVGCALHADGGQIKCNRLKPSCEACQAFNCPCVYGTQLKDTNVLTWELELIDGLQMQYQRNADRRQTCSKLY